MPSVPVITVVGWSGSGKTTLLTKVVAHLSELGVRVGVIKHHGHAPDGVDVEGKDSWSYAHAGANPVVLSSASQYAIFRTVDKPARRDELVAHIADEVDMVIVEGFRSEADGAVEVSRKATGKGPKLDSDERIALITDDEELALLVRAEGKPVFALDDYEAIARYFIDYSGIEMRR